VSRSQTPVPPQAEADGPQHPSTTPGAVGEAGAERLSNAVIWTYAAPRIGVGIMGVLFGTYLMKFATDVLLIAPAAMGSLIALSRFWDAISDPMAGYLSDRTRSRAGRRRSWLYASAIPMGCGLVMIWSPPFSLSGTWIVVWMGLALLVYETASTAFFVPHGALGVELTPNYHERTRLFGWTHMIGALGMFLGLGALQLMNSAEDKRSFAFLLSMVAGSTVALIVLVSTRLLPERKDYQGRGGDRPLRSFVDIFRNPHARLLLIVFGVETFGAASIGLLVPYLLEYVLPMKAMLVPVLITYTLPQFALTPLWISLARRFGKKPLWLSSMLLAAVSFASLFAITEPGPMIWLGAFALGVAGGCGAVVAPAIKADVIDYDEYLTAQRKEGAYLAAWNLVRKSAASVTAFLTGLVLQGVGFEPNVEQTEEVKVAIRALVSLLPAACYVAGALLFLRFSFNEPEHARVRAALDERARGNDERTRGGGR
jgi:GPH family glycoside/pentoside/hexuronide:cation symporter